MPLFPPSLYFFGGYLQQKLAKMQLLVSPLLICLHLTIHEWLDLHEISLWEIK
jgi:hypothetical protein